MASPPINKNTKSKERIKSSALKLFSEVGFEAASVRDIANDARINISMISYYFGTKENLLIRLFADFERLNKRLTKEILPIESPYQKLLFLIQFYIELNSENWQIFSVLNQEINKSDKSVIAEDIKKWRIFFYQSLQDILTHGIQQGIFYKYDIMVLYSTLIGGVNEYILHQICRSQSKPETLIIDCSDFFKFQKEVVDKVLVKSAI